MTGPKPGRGSRLDAREHARDREVDVVHRPEDLVVEAVEADRDPSQPGGGKRPRLLREQRAVRGQREIEPGDLGEHRDEPVDVAAQQRLAAGQADLLDALSRHEDPREARNLLERQQLGAAHELVVVAEDLARHAVRAAEVAAVGDRDPQVAQRAAERVDGVHRSKASWAAERPARPAATRLERPKAAAWAASAGLAVSLCARGQDLDGYRGSDSTKRLPRMAQLAGDLVQADSILPPPQVSLPVAT